MQLYYYFFLFIVSFIIFVILRSLVLRKKNVSVELFVKALRNENSGHFEEAIVIYESALSEVKKIRFNRNLKLKIIEKLKILHTLIEYKNGVRFIRQYQSVVAARFEPCLPFASGLQAAAFTSYPVFSVSFIVFHISYFVFIIRIQQCVNDIIYLFNYVTLVVEKRPTFA